MNDLGRHDALLLGRREDWLVRSVDLDLAAQRVEIRLQHNPQADCCCPECGLARPLKDHAEERAWRHLDPMQFQTTVKARTPRTNCPDCGVLSIHVPWGAPHGRFTLLFEAFASAAEHVPEADIVHDRCHIAKHLNDAVDQVRRA